MIRTRVAVALNLCAAVLSLACDEDKPYTPFEVITELPERPAATPETAPSAAPAPEAPQEVFRRALKAPRNATTWKVGERTLRAPEGQIFELGLPLPGKPDDPSRPPATLAWTQSKEPPTTGALWLYERDKPLKLTDLPGFIPISPDCERQAHLDQTGSTTVTLDVSARCTARLVARAPVRALLVTDPYRDDPVLMGFRVADSAPGETLELSIDSKDLDGDGRDDVTLRTKLTATASKASASLQFVWFDRAAGRSRDAREPAESFKKAAARLSSLAKNKKNASSVAAEADAVRRLYASVCAESGTPRLWALNGSGLNCGAQESLAALFAAEITAALTLDRPVEALGLLERDGWFGAKLSEKERGRLEQSVLAKVQKHEPTVAGTFSVNLRPATSEPRLSPLQFDTTGLLWITTADARVLLSDPPGTSARSPLLGVGGAPNAISVPEPWNLRVANSAGRTWTGVIPSCDRSEIQLSFVGRDGTPFSPQATELLAPRPGACGQTFSPNKLTATPIGWRGNQLEAWVAGKLLGDASQGRTATPGSPLSPNGKTLVLPSSLGLILVQDDRVELWRGDAVRNLRDCVPSDGGGQVACVKGRSVVVLKRSAG